MPVDAEAVAEFAALGVKVEADPDAGAPTEVWPPNWPVMSAWLECQTSWRVATTPAGLLWIGLDYGAVRLVLDDMDTPAGVFADLRFMERAALPVLNED